MACYVNVALVCGDGEALEWIAERTDHAADGRYTRQYTFFPLHAACRAAKYTRSILQCPFAAHRGIKVGLRPTSSCWCILLFYFSDLFQGVVFVQGFFEVFQAAGLVAFS